MNTQSSLAYSDHDEIWLLIPWYANGSLAGSERNRVKAHIQVCLLCRRELSNQTMLAKKLEHTPRVEISSKPSFERLMTRIHEEDESKSNRISQPIVSQQRLSRWRLLLDEFFTTKHMVPVFATALLAIAIALQFGGIPSKGIKDYHTVANSHELDRFGTQDIRVIFADRVTEQEISGLIGSIQGNIVDHPNSVSAMTVRIPDGMSIDHAINQLRGSKLVIFAEPALPQSDKPNGGGG